MFTVLLNKLLELQIITENEANTVKDLYTLTSLLQGKANSFLAPECKAYTDKVKKAIDAGDWDGIRYYSQPPKEMVHYHKTLIRLLPIISSSNK
jgi:hypothetical protein